jgi:hypothetical protein
MAKRTGGFTVGEIAKLVYSCSGRIPVGAEVEVVEPLLPRKDLDIGGPKRCYGVSYEGHPETLYVTPDQLRKLDPPGDPSMLVQWSDCPWQPGREHSRKDAAPR